MMKWKTIKIVKSLEDSRLLLKGVGEAIENEAKEQKPGVLSLLLGTLVASLLGIILAGKGIVRAGYGNKRERGIVRSGHGKKTNF